VDCSAACNPAAAAVHIEGQVQAGGGPAKVVVNEMTTVASVWTNAQFLDGTAIKGPRSVCASPRATCRTSSISQTADGAVAIQDPLNSGQTPTMANFATLADAARGLRDAGHSHCLRQCFPGGQGSRAGDAPPIR
jgi:hypothetical protein